MARMAIPTIAAAAINLDGVSDDNPHRAGGSSEESLTAPLRYTLSGEQWDIVRYNGIHMLNLQSEDSYATSLAYAQRYAPRWADRISSAWENPRYLAQAGWTAEDEQQLPKIMRLARLRSALAGYRLAPDLESWVMKVVTHANVYADTNGTSHAPSHSTYSFLMNKRTTNSTLLWTSLFSPGYMINVQSIAAPIPPLKHASDLIYLEYYRYWQEDRSFPSASPDGGSQIPAPKNIVVTDIDNQDTLLVLREIQARSRGSGSNSSGTARRARPFPGQVWDRETVEMHALMGTPIAGAVGWFLVHRKHVFGAKSVLKIRIFASDGKEDWNLWFEIGEV